MAKIKRLDGGKIRMTVQQIMDHTGLGRAAVNHRLKQSKKSEVVLAPKGKHVIGGYKKAADLEKQKAKLQMSDVYTIRKMVKRRKMSVDTQNKVILTVAIIWTIGFVVEVAAIVYFVMISHQLGSRFIWALIITNL